MASVERYPTNKGYRYRVRYRKPDGSQTDKRGFTTKRDAELFLASVEVSKARGEFVSASASRATVRDLGIDWLANKRAAMKPSSFAPVEIAWAKYVDPRWGSVSVGDVQSSDVKKWVRQLAEGTAPTDRSKGKPISTETAKPKSATTVRRAVGVLSGILDDALADRRISRNPARGLDNLPRKRSAKPRRYLTHAEVAALAKATNDEQKATLVRVLAYCGLRWGELIALRVRDVNFLRRRLEIRENAVWVNRRIHLGTPKSHEARSVPYPAFLAPALEILAAGKAPSDLLFQSEAGSYLPSPETSQGARGSWLAGALARAELERLTAHDLRHTAASLAVSAGANVKAVQRMLGHASAAMTLDVYSDLFDDDLDAVAEALDRAVSGTDVGRMWAIRPDPIDPEANSPVNQRPTGTNGSVPRLGLEPRLGRV